MTRAKSKHACQLPATVRNRHNCIHCTSVFLLYLSLFHLHVSFRAVEVKRKAVQRIEEQLMKLQVQATDREENKQIALGTSKLNYLDPRISVAWYLWDKAHVGLCLFDYRSYHSINKLWNEMSKPPTVWWPAFPEWVGQCAQGAYLPWWQKGRKCSCIVGKGAAQAKTANSCRRKIRGRKVWVWETIGFVSESQGASRNSTPSSNWEVSEKLSVAEWSARPLRWERVVCSPEPMPHSYLWRTSSSSTVDTGMIYVFPGFKA